MNPAEQSPSAVLETFNSKTDLSELIKRRARFEGFDKVGIVRCEALHEEGLHLNQWLSRGFHGEMSWMHRDVERRIDPAQIFPDARSVVVVTLNYFTPAKHQNDPGTGKVSRYAW